MGFFIIGIIIILAGIVGCVYGAIEHEGGPKAVGAIAAIVGVVVFAISFFGHVPTGYTGIVTTFGKVHDTTLDAGIHTKSPFDTVVTMDNREQRLPFELQAFSSDIQEVSVKGSVTLNIDKSTAMTLYRDVGTGYLDILVRPRIEEDVKSIFSKYTAEGLISNRNDLSASILSLMRGDLSGRGLNIISVAIENIDFTDAFTNAVEAKQVASQELQKAKTQQEQQTMEAQQTAERQKIKAQADADVAKINADADAYAIRTKAEAEADANEKIAKSITNDLIEYNKSLQWDGKLPSVYGGGGLLPILTGDD